MEVIEDDDKLVCNGCATVIELQGDSFGWNSGGDESQLCSGSGGSHGASQVVTG